MPRVVPSQIVALIDRILSGIPDQGPGPGFPLQAPKISAVIDLASELPDEFLVLSMDEYMGYYVGILRLKELLNWWQNQPSAPALNLRAVKAAAQSLSSVRALLAKCPDEMPSTDIRDAGMGVNSERKTILVVDDDLGPLYLKSLILKECGYNVLRAPDGERALALLRDNDRIDLLYTDIPMPEPNGIEVARRAREQIPDLKVLFSSGTEHENLKLSDRLLTVPFRTQQLRDAVAAALGTSAGE
jgi:CheY-like chemotaxis protein